MAFKVLGVILLAVLWGLVKYLSHTYPIGQIAFFRSLFGLLPVIVLIALHTERLNLLKTRRPLGHVWRASAGTLGMFLSFLTLSLLPIGDATALAFSAPLILLALAALFLREQVGPYRLGAVSVGFLGVLLVAAPHLSEPSSASHAFVGVLTGLAAAFFIAAAQMFMRAISNTETSVSIVFYFTVTTTLVSALTLPFAYVKPDGEGLWLLVLTGLVGGVAQYFVTLSYRFADASMLAPFDYVQLPFALAIGLLVFQEVPTSISIAGATIIMASGVFIALRERYLARRRGRTPPPVTPLT